MAENVTVDGDAVCESLGDAPTMLPRALSVGLEAAVEVASEHGKTVTVVVHVARLDWLEAETAPPADWGSAMSAGYAELATGWIGTL